MSTSESDFHPLNTDSALTDPEKAFASRKRFARQLSDQLKRLPKDEPTVTAIHGSWGSGKTTVWNLAKDHLNRDELDILEFNPWRILDEDTMIRQFFSELRLKVVEIDSDPTGMEKRAKLWDALAKACGLAGHVVTAADAVATVAVPGLAQVGAATLRHTISGVQSASETARDDVRQKIKEDSSLDSIRDRLITALKKTESQKQILVVVDDLDRLTDDDIYLVIRMVKAVASLPRIHFLLLYDRPQVEAALGRKSSYDGHKYLSKIVQLERTLPFISHSDLLSMVQHVVFGVETPLDMKSDENTTRLRNLYSNAWTKVLVTPRDWNRFGNAFSSNWGWGKTQCEVELNPVDVVALELLRIAAPKLFLALPFEKDFLLGEDIASQMSDNDAELKERFSSFLDQAEDRDRKVCEYLVRFLFPSVATIEKNRESLLASARTQLRVCDPECFLRYFHLDANPEMISESELESILQISDKRDACLQRLIQFNEQPKFIDFIQRIRDDAETLKRIGFPGPFISALMEAADHSTGSPIPFIGSSVSGIIHATWLANDLADTLPSSEKYRAWNIAISDTGSRIAITYWLANNHPKTPRNERRVGLLGEAEAASLMDMLRKKWPCWLNDVEWFLGVRDNLGSFFWIWSRWGELDNVTHLVRRLIETNEGVLTVLRAICGSVSSGDKTRRTLSTKSISELIPFSEFTTAVERARPFLQKPENAPYLDAYTHLDKDRLE